MLWPPRDLIHAPFEFSKLLRVCQWRLVCCCLVRSEANILHILLERIHWNLDVSVTPELQVVLHWQPWCKAQLTTDELSLVSSIQFWLSPRTLGRYSDALFSCSLDESTHRRWMQTHYCHADLMIWETCSVAANYTANLPFWELFVVIKLVLVSNNDRVKFYIRLSSEFCDISTFKHLSCFFNILWNG